MLDATLPRVPATPRAKRDVMISGYDLKFIRELGGRLDNRTDLDVALDEWPAISQRSEETAALAASVDTIVAEWARPTAAWLAEQKKPGQYVVVRLHRSSSSGISSEDRHRQGDAVGLHRSADRAAHPR